MSTRTRRPRSQLASRNPSTSAGSGSTSRGAVLATAAVFAAAAVSAVVFVLAPATGVTPGSAAVPGGGEPAFESRSPPPVSDTLSLEPCELPRYDGPARCGHLRVPEDPDLAGGRRIALNVAVLEARADTARPDPLFVFAGGPGQAATEYAAVLGHQMPDLLREHDVVLVDRRGTGRSNPLRCGPRGSPDDPVANLKPVTRAYIRGCRQDLETRADLRLYTTPYAVDDVDRVRQVLGYHRINLYGASYGSREALVYLRRHGEHVRSVMLEAAMPLDRRPFLMASRFAQQSLERLFDDCLADARCRRAYPSPHEDLAAVLARLDRGPVDYHPPSGGERADRAVRLSGSVVTSTLRTLLVFPSGGSRIPAALHRAAGGDYRELGDLALRFRGSTARSLSRGLFLSVVCAEEAARIDESEIGPATRDSFWGDTWIRSILGQCGQWTRGRLPPDYFEPVRSNVPVLIFAGWLDPITPPAWAASLAGRLPNARRVVVREGQHNFQGGTCFSRLTAEFVNRIDPQSLDATCVAHIERPPFTVGAAQGTEDTDEGAQSRGGAAAPSSEDGRRP